MAIHGKKDLICQSAFLVALGSTLALYGIRWGLPSRARLDRVMPPHLDTPETRRGLSGTWAAMHERLGENLMINPESWKTFSGVRRTQAGWSEIPEIMKNSLRSFHVRSAHEDEQSILISLSRMRPKRLEMNTHMFTYGTHIYAVGASLAAGAAVGLVSLHRSLEPYMAEPSKMAALYMPGRLLSVAAYLACGLMLLSIGRRRLGPGVGLVAAAIFLMSPAAVVQAHVMKQHTLWPFLALLAIDRAVEVLNRGRMKDYAIAGLLSGITVSVCFAGWVTCLVIAAASALRILESGYWTRELKGLALAAACSLGIFLILNPYWILAANEAILEMKVFETATAPFSLSRPFIYIWGPIRRSFTEPVLALMTLGGVMAARRGRKDPALFLCLCAVLLGLFGITRMTPQASTRIVRYIIAWTAVASLLAGHAAMALWNLKGKWRPWARAGIAAVLLNLGLTGMSYSHNFHLENTLLSTHWLAGRWLESNAPAGATVGLLRLPQPSNAPFFRYDLYNMVFIEPPLFGNLALAELPEYLALTIPDYDDRPGLEPNLSRYQRLASFDRGRLFSWISIDETSTTANPLIEIYRLRGAQ